MLLLTNEHVATALSMSECIAALDELYREMAEGGSLSRHRSDVVVPTSNGPALYALKSMDGVSTAAGVGAVRINSDVLLWPEEAGFTRRTKVPAAPGGRWVGLVLLFDVDTGAPIAMLPDGVLQQMRVAGTSALAADHLARSDAEVLALLGSGWQAEGAIEAASLVRPLREVRVFSPHAEHRREFAERWDDRLEAAVRPADTAAGAMHDASVVLATTNSLQPVIERDWVRPGMHLGTVKRQEVRGDVLERASVVALSSDRSVPDHQLHPDIRHFPEFPELTGGRSWTEADPSTHEGLTLLSDVVAGRGRRRSGSDEITVFLNNMGLGAQFAAVGAAVLDGARRKGLGRDLPSEWFTQDVHP